MDSCNAQGGEEGSWIQTDHKKHLLTAVDALQYLYLHVYCQHMVKILWQLKEDKITTYDLKIFALEGSAVIHQSLNKH